MAWIARLFWLLLAIVVFLVALLAVNQEPVSLTFLNWRTPEASVFWWLLSAFLLGLALGLVGALVLTLQLRLNNRKLSRRLASVEAELSRARGRALEG